MNNTQKKLRYIRIKNSWRRPGQELSKFVITVGTQHNFEWNPKYPLSEIHMDFTKRDDIIKYGVKNVRF